MAANVSAHGIIGEQEGREKDKKEGREIRKKKGEK